MNHPYDISAPAVGSQFFGRKILLASVLQTFAVSSQNVVIIFGQARSGKTSVLHQLAARLSDQEYLPVYWGLKDKVTLSDQHPLQSLAETIAAQVQLRAPNLLTKRNADYFHTYFLRQVHKKIAPRRLVVLVDDIDVLREGQAEATSLLSYLPQLIAKAHSTAFVLSTGTKLPELPLSWQSINQQGRYEELPFLTFQETWSLVTQGSRHMPTGYSAKAIDQIWKLAAGHPYYVQLICHESFDYIFSQKKNQVDAALVEKVLPHVLEKAAPDLAKLTADLSEPVLKTLLGCALAFKQTKAIRPEFISEILAQYQLAVEARDVHQAFKELQERAILYQSEKGDFYFTVPLIAEWMIAKYSPNSTTAGVIAAVPPKQKPSWKMVALVGGSIALFLATVIGIMAFDAGPSPTRRSAVDTPILINESALTVPAALAITSTPSQDQSLPAAADFLAPTPTAAAKPAGDPPSASVVEEPVSGSSVAPLVKDGSILLTLGGLLLAGGLTLRRRQVR
jgi:hypothetical protein